LQGLSPIPLFEGYNNCIALLLEEIMSVEIYHNPRCSKSRQTLALLKEQGIEPEVVKYLETPPDATQLDHILELLQLQPRDLMRKKEQEYKSLGLDNPELSREQLIQSMVEHPKLIERPIVIVDNSKAALGRPPEQVLELF
jgi:arsenate reductase